MLVFLETFSVKRLFFTANVLTTSGIFYYFHFSILCKSINTELNANEIKLYTLYSATITVYLFQHYMS